MEFLILIIAGIVVYYLYVTLQEYLKNPMQKNSRESEDNFDYHLKEDPYKNLEFQEGQEIEKFAHTELGVMLEIIKRIPQKEKNIEVFEKIVKNFIEQYVAIYPDIQKDSVNANEFFLEQPSDKPLIDIASEFLSFSYAEYKKRLRFIEFLLMLLYLDGVLSEHKKEFLLDVASVLELDNEDFNKIYDAYEQQFEKLETQNDTDEHSISLEEAIKEQINIFDSKNASKDLLEDALRIRKSFKQVSLS